MNRVYVLPYQPASVSAREVARGLGVKRIKRVGSRYVFRLGDTIINWGCTSGNLPDALLLANGWVNPPISVERATDKVVSMVTLRHHDVPTVPFTTFLDEAKEWDGVVYCRTKVKGKGGDGIVVARTKEELVPSPLYTQYLNAKAEYRVHVAFGKVIDQRRKAKREGVPGNKYIRNHANGYVYKKEGIDVPVSVGLASINAVKALGLDFGAVDILYYRGEPYVLEVNSAPGVHGTTIKNYVKVFKEELGL